MRIAFRFLVVAFVLKGRDSNHVELQYVRVCKALLLVGPDYHALHHMYPAHFHGSWTKLIDYFAGTAATPVSAQVRIPPPPPSPHLPSVRPPRRCFARTLPRP